MQLINGQHQSINLSTEATSFKELDAFSIAVLEPVFCNYIKTKLLGKALKYVEGMETFNLINSLGGLASKKIQVLPPLSEIKCSEQESILAQNKILKKCRQVKSALLSQGNEHARSKYIKHFNQLYKLAAYNQRNLNGVLNNSFTRELLTAFMFVADTPLGQQLIEHFAKYQDDFYPQLNSLRGVVTEIESRRALNDLVDKAEAAIRRPFLVGDSDVERSNELIVSHRLAVLTRHEREILQMSCISMPAQELAKLLLPLSEVDKSLVFKFLASKQHEAVKSELARLEADHMNEVNLSLFEKPKYEHQKWEQDRKEFLNLISYRVLARIEGAVAEQLEKVSAWDKEDDVPVAPHHFAGINDFSDETLAKVLWTTSDNVLQHAFYYLKGDPLLGRINSLSPNKLRVIEEGFDSLKELAKEEVSIEAQEQMLNALDRTEKEGYQQLESNKKVSAEQNLPIENEEKERLTPQTKPVFDLAELESVMQERDIIGEPSAELLKKIIEKGAERKLLYASKEMLNEVEILKEEFPNFVSVLTEIEMCLAISFKVKSPIEFPVICLDSAPGLGKTHFVKTLCQRLGFDFTDVSVATMGSKHDLVGGSSQFKNSSLGFIGKTLCLNGETAQPCVLFDEVCLANPHSDYSIIPSLLGLFDADQRKSVKERYLDINLDCSGMLIFCTTNNWENVLPALQSRLTKFEISTPSKQEMVTISSNIYKSFLKDKNLTNLFEETLNGRVCDALSEMIPREAKKTLTSAIRKALLRSIDSDEKISVEIGDLPTLSKAYQAKAPLGFVH